MTIRRNDAPMTLRPGVQSPIATGARHFPTELLQEVIILTLSRYLRDVLIAPTSTRRWDAIGALLHVDQHFRSCTVSVLEPLWGNKFTESKTGYPRNYTNHIEYLRELAELAQTNPEGVLPPARHVLSMFRNIAPYERLGRYFVAYEARLNFKMSLATAVNDRRHIHDDLSNLILGFSTLPKWLQDPMFAEFADYVVSDLLVRVRAYSFRLHVRDAARYINDFYEGMMFMRNPGLESAQKCMQKVCELAGLLGRDEDDVECVLSCDAVSRNLFETLLPEMRSLEAQGGTGRELYNAWMPTLSILLTSKEREMYGMAPE